MKTYEISVPISAISFVTVEAETEQEALDKALDAASLDSVEQWEPLRHVTSGNVCCALLPWEITITDSYEVD